MADEGATPAQETPEQKQDKPEGAAKAPNGDAPLGEAGEKALEAFKQRARDAEKRAKELEARVQEHEERDKSELEKLTGKLGKAEQAKAEAETRLLRFEVAAEKQVPAEAVDLLTGTTREELEARADKLLELIKSRNDNTTPDFDGGPRDPAPEPKTPEDANNEFMLQLARQLHGPS